MRIHHSSQGRYYMQGALNPTRDVFFHAFWSDPSAFREATKVWIQQ